MHVSSSYCRSARRVFRPALLIATLAILFCVPLQAQEVKTIGNQFVQTHLDITGKRSRFWITAGATKFLYATGDFITSNVVFKIKRGSDETYYCNLPVGVLPAQRPRIPGGSGEATFAPFDSLYISPGSDTMAVVWRDIDGFKIVMRFVVEKPTSVYDTGSDILLEFDYALNPFGVAGDLNIFLMLDTFNNEADGNSGTSDQTSIVTDQGYLASDGFGKVYSSQFDVIPEFYHAGNPRYQLPLNTTLSVHRLKGFSHGGAPLTMPNLFAVGRWQDFRYLSWDINPGVGSTQIKDCATICRWENLGGFGKVRTAFGLSDQGGNNLFTCRDSAMFVDIRTVRVVEQKVKNGPYSPLKFDVEMWVSNLNLQFGLNANIRLVTPIQSMPSNTARITLDPSTPALQSVQLTASGTKKLVWTLNVDPKGTDTLASLLFKYTLPGKPERTFRQGCTPYITIKGYMDPPPPDNMPPVIQRGTPGRGATAYWPFTTFDRHPNFNFDTGLDTTRIIIENNVGNNFTLKRTPTTFRQCDVNETINLLAEVVDTTRSAKIIFAVYDCQGNVSRDSASYSPRPDVFRPEIIRIDSLPSPAYACNTRRYEVTLRDHANQTPISGDNGFGKVEVIGTADNFTFEPNFDRAPLKDFDSIATFRVSVIDTMANGSISVRFSDYAGNSDSIAFSYCTLPDTAAPVATVMVLSGNESWQIDASDTSAWDRGLQDIVVLSNLNSNMSYTPPALGLGDRTTSFQVGVIDDAKDADIILEIRDTWYQYKPDGHADTVHLRFSGMPDIMAPNILYTPVPGTRGAKVDVEANDIHQGYRYDLGLATVRAYAITPNMQFSVPISFSPGDMTTTFQIEVIDTLAIGTVDSVVIEAIDLAGNRSRRAYSYPLVPDTLPPLFSGALSSDRSRITGIASDARDYDRGLSSITIENPVNLDPTFAMNGLNGVASVPLTLDVLDPHRPVSGTLVIRDLIAEKETTPEVQAAHTTRVPFRLATAGLALRLPAYVEGNSEFTAAIVATDSFPSSQIGSIDYTVHYAGNVEFRRASGVRSQLTAGLAKAVAASGLHLRTVTDPGENYLIGDTLGLLVFYANRDADVEEFTVTIDDASIVANDGMERVVEVPSGTPGDTAISRLVLPAPFTRVVADSLSYINRTCGRIMFTLGARGKRTGLDILGIRPQPFSSEASGGIEIDIQDLPKEEARAELVSVDGRTAARFTLPSGTGGVVTRISVPLPADLPSGVYFLRLSGSTGNASARVVVVQ
jgi:hypothetical protein